MWPNRWKTLTAWATLVFSAAMVLLAVRALAAPASAAGGFGLALINNADGAFVQVYASRNAALAVTAIALLLLGQLTPLAVLISIIALLPLADMAVVAAHAGTGPVLLRHAVFLVVLVALAASLWRQVSRHAAVQHALRRAA